MKISELAALSGIPKTSIHYYQREGLLPALVKTARNAASYDKAHVERLHLIAQLRQARLPMAHMKRAIALVEQGVPVATALALQQALTEGEGSLGLDLAALAAAADVPLHEAEDCLRQGLLGKPARRAFGDADEAALRALAAMRRHGTSLAFLDASAARVRQLVAAEFALADTLVAGMPQPERSGVLLDLQRAVDFLHPFWLSQARQQEVFSRWPASLQALLQEPP